MLEFLVDLTKLLTKKRDTCMATSTIRTETLNLIVASG